VTKVLAFLRSGLRVIQQKRRAKEGAALAQAVGSRTEFLRSLINAGGSGLEIGAGYNPLLPKSAGFRVEVADHTTAEGLRAKYRDAPNVDVANIEPVDYVLAEGSLAKTIGKQACYDYIVASHVIEHTPDLLGFLKDCEALLKPDGILLLAVPDKRCCFDIFQPLTSAGAVLQAHLDRRTRPGPGVIFDDRAYNAVREGAIGWPLQSTGELRFFLNLPAALSQFTQDRRSADYTDVHVWKFVPSSFRLIVNDLYELGEIRLRERQFHEGAGHEFYITLSREADGCRVERIELARRMLAEQAQALA
jgi:2-polyprenyl-3-methyl-5-hydroxy-6-metoxy-1,4-benzoquinol methylase